MFFVCPSGAQTNKLSGVPTLEQHIIGRAKTWTFQFEGNEIRPVDVYKRQLLGRVVSLIELFSLFQKS